MLVYLNDNIKDYFDDQEAVTYYYLQHPHLISIDYTNRMFLTAYKLPLNVFSGYDDITGTFQLSMENADRDAENALATIERHKQDDNESKECRSDILYQDSMMSGNTVGLIHFNSGLTEEVGNRYGRYIIHHL